jgi:hypothetical protein
MGCLTGWSPNFKALSMSSSISTISMNLKHKYVDYAFSVINIYNPYSDRIPFWEDLKNEGIFNDPFTVMRGDLNFTLSLREVWGPISKRGSTTWIFSIFSQICKSNGCGTSEAHPDMEKFSNRRDEVVKRLDRFLFHNFFWRRV